MSLLVDRCIFTPVSGGTGDFVVNAAVVGYQTPAQANAVNGVIYSYAAQSGDLTQWEIGQGTYTAGTTTLTRAKVLANSSGTTALINFGNPPQVTLTALTEDLSSSGVINIGDIIPLVADGLTDNYNNNWLSFSGGSGLAGDPFQNRGYCKTQGPASLATIVTFTLASPGVVHWTAHGLRVDETVVFSTTGALPTGLVAGVPYFVMYANLTADTFQVSAVSRITISNTGLAVAGPQGADGPAVNFTGSQSGTQYARTLATETQQLLMSPGAYHGSNLMNGLSYQKELVFSAYGVVADQIQFGSGIFSTGYGGYAAGNAFVSAPLTRAGSVTQQYSTLTLLNISDAPKFWVGGWVVVGALDLQNSLGNLGSYPPNNHYFEFAQISAIDYIGGVLTTTTPLRNIVYDRDFPNFVDGSDQGGPGFTAGGGRITAWPLEPGWDTRVIVKGGHFTDGGIAQCRDIKFVDCTFGPLYAFGPSVNQSFVMERCKFLNDINIEQDKFVEYVRYTDCDFIGPQCGIYVPSSSIEILVVEGCSNMGNCGTARNTYIRNSYIFNLGIGVAYGACDSLVIENCRIPQIVWSYLSGSGNIAGAIALVLNYYTFSNGTFSAPLQSNLGPNRWAVPGRRMWINDLGFNFTSMGAPFIITNVYGSWAAQATATISIANPAVVTWNSHGRSARDVIVFTTTGTLPTGILTTTPYYVLAAGLTANTFEFSASPGGSPVVTTSTQSGTHTATANPTFNFDTTLKSLPVGNSTNSTVTIDIANPAVIHWPSHGLSAGTLVIFMTTGALPTGLSINVLYYVLAAGLTTNAFEVSTSVGGSPVVTSGSQSGTQTAVSNPLKFEGAPVGRITVRNCTGCRTMEDLSNSPANVAPFSYASYRFDGYQSSNLATYSPVMQALGNLVSMVINVEKPYTGSLPHGSSSMTMNISAPAFNDSLIESDLNMSVDLTIAGTRTVTPAGVTGSTGADSLSAFGNWLGNTVNITFTGGSNFLSAQPSVLFTIKTDQGPLDPVPVAAGVQGANAGGVETIIDTSPLHGAG